MDFFFLGFGAACLFTTVGSFLATYWLLMMRRVGAFSWQRATIGWLVVFVGWPVIVGWDAIDWWRVRRRMRSYRIPSAEGGIDS